MIVLKKYVLFSMVMLWAAGVAHANGIEEKFIRAGLVDVHQMDETIQVDLVNSDPRKNYLNV
ncbi:hypothetical protein [Desulfoluna butyratoxydans]|uniref:Uncharacterized protein n=1 Tax=Desulfoluna butyratoxydans TaxID=231438 RepID=A0A4V6ILG1_9BACT|nr:hypothetical protein [Desulfoluna butyratoxydans]VFQ44938.1 hypothetical protein MSL71_25950 [Desulfoluna butyratoxydans]